MFWLIGRLRQRLVEGVTPTRAQRGLGYLVDRLATLSIATHRADRSATVVGNGRESMLTLSP